MGAVVIGAIPMGLWGSIGLGSLVHTLLWLGVCVHLLYKPRDARTALLWIFFTSAFPFLGPLAYVLFGINTVPSKGWQKQHSDIAFEQRQRRSRRSLHPLSGFYECRNQMRVKLLDQRFLALEHVLERRAPNHPLFGGNQIDVLEPATLAIEEMLLAIQQARHHVHLTTYIIGDDALGRRFLDLLAEKGADGVQVRVLYDAFGSARASLRLFFQRYRKVPNLQLVGFSQANVFKRKFQLGLRNHRKLLIVDGELAFTGGINFYDVYLPRDVKPGILDYHFRVRGPIVSELQYTFLRDWYYMTDASPETFFERCFYPLPKEIGTMVARLQNSGPTREEQGAALDAMLAAIHHSQKQIFLVTPYFVPPEALLLALRQAAFRRVEVKILLPSVNNYPTLKLAARANYASLLRVGVRIYEREAPFLHAKALLVDDGVAIIGSTNFDARSLLMNYETNLVVYDSHFAARLKQTIWHDLSHAHEIFYAQWRQRPVSHRMLENFFNLFHPIA